MGLIKKGGAPALIAPTNEDGLVYHDHREAMRGPWKRMNRQCYRPEISTYRLFGAIGIKVEWRSYQEFVNDMWPSFKVGHKLVRVYEQFHFSQRNCAWIPMDLEKWAPENAYGLDAEEFFPILTRVWGNAKNRCHCTSNDNYPNYGGRGIIMESSWDHVRQFFIDMWPTYQPGLWLDRFDNDGNYCHTNCRWATCTEQQKNKSTNVWVNTPTGQMCLSDAAKSYGLSRHTVDARKRRGWPESRWLEPSQSKFAPGNKPHIPSIGNLRVCLRDNNGNSTYIDQTPMVPAAIIT